MTIEFDEIGYWSEIKLEIIEKYASAYSKAFSNHKYLHVSYIDAFAGPGKHISQATGNFVRGSPEIALDISPKFKEFYFIDINGDKVSELLKLVESRPEAHVLKGDCNTRLLKDVFPHIGFNDYKEPFVYSILMVWISIGK